MPLQSVEVPESISNLCKSQNVALPCIIEMGGVVIYRLFFTLIKYSNLGINGLLK